MGWDGYERQYKWNEGEKQWDTTQHEPRNDCDAYNKCGNFAECSLETSPNCECLRGFEPKELENWDNGNWSDGCKRRTPLKAERNISNSSSNSNSSILSVEEDGFVELRCRKLPDCAKLLNSGNQDDCESQCLKDTNCTAYAYVNGIGCLVWHGELIDVQHFENAGNTLFIRLAHSELGKVTKKSPHDDSDFTCFYVKIKVLLKKISNYC